MWKTLHSTSKQKEYHIEETSGRVRWIEPVPDEEEKIQFNSTCKHNDTSFEVLLYISFFLMSPNSNTLIVHPTSSIVEQWKMCTTDASVHTLDESKGQYSQSGKCWNGLPEYDLIVDMELSRIPTVEQGNAFTYFKKHLHPTGSVVLVVPTDSYYTYYQSTFPYHTDMHCWKIGDIEKYCKASKLVAVTCNLAAYAEGVGIQNCYLAGDVCLPTGERLADILKLELSIRPIITAEQWLHASMMQLVVLSHGTVTPLQQVIQKLQ